MVEGDEPYMMNIKHSIDIQPSVATKAATNPVYDLGAALQLPLLQQVTQHVELPIKLLFPTFVASAKGGYYRMMMLGLGDIALPGGLGLGLGWVMTTV